MKTLIWFMLIAALAAGFSLAAIHNDGYALFVLSPWRVELSLNLLLIISLIGFFLFYLLLRGLAALFVLPVSVREYRVRRAREHADSALRDAVMMALEGRFSRALRLAEIAYSAGHAPLLSALVAQQAAHGMRDQHREVVWRDRARQHEDKKSMGARLMVEAGIAADNRDFQTARDLLEQFARSDGRHVAALRLALRVYQGLGQWYDVERVVRQLEKHRAMTPDQAAPLRQRAQREVIAELEHRGETGGQLEHFLRDLPDVDRLESRLVLHAAPLLIKANNHPEAARLIEDALDVRWDSDLVAAYGDCGGDTLAYIANAERWLPAHPHDAKLLLTLGRLCRRQQLWGKAQSYLDASLATQASRWAHLELAALLDQLGKPDQANVHYRAAAGVFSK